MTRCGFVPVSYHPIWRCTIAILPIIDKLEELLEQGRPVPLSQFRVINAEEFAQLLEHLRINLPSSIRESERLLAERDRLLAQAESHAEELVATAEAQARELLSDNALIEAANNEAERIIYESKLMAQQRTHEADAYATDVLEQLADRLGVISQQVENGLRMMRAASASSAEGPEPAGARKTPAPAPGESGAASADAD
jgi:cell division septum initiation protein DivIVA